MKFMNQAFLLAKKAELHGDVPIGAVIVQNGKMSKSLITLNSNCKLNFNKQLINYLIN